MLCIAVGDGAAFLDGEVSVWWVSSTVLLVEGCASFCIVYEIWRGGDWPGSMWWWKKDRWWKPASVVCHIGVYDTYLFLLCKAGD